MTTFRKAMAAGLAVSMAALVGFECGGPAPPATGQFPPEPNTPAPADGVPAAAQALAAPTATAPAAPFVPLVAGTVDGTWVAQGPAPTINAQVQNLNPNNEVDGAIHAVVAHPTDPDILYVGAVNGGVWVTNDATNASPSWTPLTDFEQSLSIGALEMDPGNPMVLLAGIGRFSSFGGDPPFTVAGGPLSGLLRTTDGGATWTSIDDPLLVGEHISSVAARGSTLLAGANDFLGGGGIGGLFRSTDTGASWTRISGGVGTGLPFGTVDDLAGEPTDATRLYAALQGNGVYRTDDTGATWTQVSNNDANLNAAMGNSTNTRIAVGNDGRVFVLVTSSPGGSTGTTTYIGYSDDQGQTWTQMDIPGTAETALQGRDQLMGLVVDPSDSDIVYASGISQRGGFPNSVGATSFHAHMFRGDVTRARGLTGTVSSQWDHLTHATGNALMPNGGTAGTSAPHADSREMTFDANGDLIEVDDGGVNRRTSPGDNTGDWTSLNGDIEVTELHSIAYDTNFDIIIGGTQDTGAVEQTGTGLKTWEGLTFADGGKVAVDDSVAGTSERYFSIQRLSSFTRRTCNPGCVESSPALAGGVPALVTGTGGNAQFYSPLELNTADPTRLLIGARDDLYESLDQGATVSTVPVTAACLPLFPSNMRANSDASMVYGHPNNAELIYVGCQTRVYVRTTAGGNLTATTAAFPGGTVQGIAVDPADEDVLYVIGSTSVYQSTDGGASWTDISGDITDDGAGTFRSIEYIPSAKGDRLVVGTNAGVRVSVDGSFGTWFQLGTDLPNAPVWDLDYDASDDVLVAGTLGRGAWTLANVATLNVPPVAICQDQTEPADAMCLADASIDGGSFDPDGDPILLTQDPAGPYGLGDTLVELTVTDSFGAADMCEATVTVVDVTPPVVSCNAPPTIIPPDAPISFTATAEDNCSVADVRITGFDCFAFTRKGRRIDKTQSCVVAILGDMVTLLVDDSGGVGDNITWNVTATDGSGNTTDVVCAVQVVRPGTN